MRRSGVALLVNMRPMLRYCWLERAQSLFIFVDRRVCAKVLWAVPEEEFKLPRMKTELAAINAGFPMQNDKGFEP